MGSLIPFLDLSSHNEDDQHQIDWPTAAGWLLKMHPEAGVIVKVSEGTNYVNPYLHRQRWGAHSAGLKNVGLYHFGRPSKNSGSDEADYFIQACGTDGGMVANEFLALDIEDTDVPRGLSLDAYCLDFLGRVYDPISGGPLVRPFLYSGNWFMQPYDLERDPKLASYPLWYASYQQVIPPCPPPWKKISLWQFTYQAQVSGIPYPVDMSWFEGDISELRQYQWGYIQSPGQGQIVVKLAPNVPGINISDPKAGDALASFQWIAKEAEALAGQLSGDQAQLALQIASNADQGATLVWGH